MVQSSAFIHCKICDKRFSGPEPYQQHVQSQKHKNKAVVVQDPSQSPASGDDMLHCEVCDISISGPIPYAQHMEGSRHKSQLNKKQIVAELSANSSGESEQTSLYPNLATVNSPLPVSGGAGTAVVVQKCELCGVVYSGPENMKEHLESKGHKRKVELENWKPVLGQNRVPASAPPIHDADTSENAVGDTIVPTIENAPELSRQPNDGKQSPLGQEQPKKQKKPLGCFGLFRRSRKNKNGQKKKDMI